MMLRASSQKTGIPTDLSVITRPEADDGGVTHGRLLIDLADGDFLRVYSVADLIAQYLGESV